MIESMESLEILGKLVYNAAVAPKEEKYRKIKLSNPKIDEKLGQVPGCIESLQLMGWQQQEAEEEGGIEFLAIAPGKFMTMKEVRVIEAAKERLKKAQAEAAKERLRSIGASSSAAVRVQA